MAAQHTATLVWERASDDFLDQRYRWGDSWPFDPQHAPAQEVLEQLHQQAHAACFLAHSVKTQIACTPVLDQKVV